MRSGQLYDSKGYPVMRSGLPKWLIVSGVLLLIPIAFCFILKIIGKLFGGIKINKDNLGLYLPGYNRRRR